MLGPWRRELRSRLVVAAGIAVDRRRKIVVLALASALGLRIQRMHLDERTMRTQR